MLPVPHWLFDCVIFFIFYFFIILAQLELFVAKGKQSTCQVLNMQIGEENEHFDVMYILQISIKHK